MGNSVGQHIERLSQVLVAPLSHREDDLKAKQSPPKCVNSFSVVHSGSTNVSQLQYRHPSHESYPSYIATQPSKLFRLMMLHCFQRSM